MTNQELQHRLLIACSALVGTGIDANWIYQTLLDMYAPRIDAAPRSYRDVHPDNREAFMQEFEHLVEKALSLA